MVKDADAQALLKAATTAVTEMFFDDLVNCGRPCVRTPGHRNKHSCREDHLSDNTGEQVEETPQPSGDASTAEAENRAPGDADNRPARRNDERVHAPSRRRLRSSAARAIIARKCATCGGPFPIGTKRKRALDKTTMRELFWHVDCPEPEEMKEWRERLGAPLDNTKGPGDVVEEVAEQMLAEIRKEYPDWPEDKQRAMAQQAATTAAALHMRDRVTGTETDIICECGEAQSRHVGGAGRCKERECSCETFTPGRVDTVAKEFKI